MGWFGNGHGERIADLERQVSALAARVVKAEATASEVAERAYRYMKKAEGRARRELDVPEESGPGAAPGTPSAPSSSQRARAWGARGRRMAAALMREHTNGAANGDGA